MALNDSLPFFAAESGTYLTTAPNPHVDLSGTVVTIGAYPARTFAAAAADTDTIFTDGDTVTVLLVIDADNWARYEGAVWNDDVTDSIDLSNATLQASEGTISNSDTVDVYAGQPIGLQSTGSTLDVNQAHTFDVGSPVYSADGWTWSLALANDADKIHIGVVSAIADSSNFTIQFVGPIVTGIDLVTLTPGEYYYLTDAGSLATTPGTIDAPALFALTSSSGVVLPFRAGSAELVIDPISTDDITAGVSTTEGSISAAKLKLAAETHGQQEPIPIGTALTDLTGLTLDQTLRTYTFNGAGDTLTVTTHAAGSWAIIRTTGTAQAISHSGITWIGGTDHNDIVSGCEILLRSDGTTVFGSVGVPT